MKLNDKIKAAELALREACEALCDMPREPKYWGDLCTAKARLCALLECAKRWA